MWILLVLTAVGVSLFRLLTSFYKLWQEQDVPTPPINLFFGNMGEVVAFRKNVGQVYADVYNKFNNLLYVGFYRVRTPAIILRDPELIQRVLVKDFQYFHDNDFEVDEKIDPMFAKNPFAIKGERWKHVRNQLTPCFSAAKMKLIFPVMQDVCQKFTTFLENQPVCVNAKDVCSLFTTENVINCAFGIEANCFKEDNPKFREMGRKLMNPNLLGTITMVIALIIPELSRFLGIQMVPDVVTNFFRKTIKEIIRYRDENQVKRSDFLENLLEIKKKSGDFDDEDITAHAIGLFLDGFETSSIALSFILYDLAANPDVQNQLFNEIKNVQDVNFDSVTNLEYLEAVINESLRLHPPAPFMQRRCTQRTKFPTPTGGYSRTNEDLNVEIPKGTVMMVPLLGLHLDEKLYPDAKTFKPERFLGKNNSNKFTFMPFGEGPRICLGMRFGLSQVKAAIFYLVRNFEIKVNKKTEEPLEIDPGYFLMAAKGGLWLDFIKRTN